MLKHIVMWKLKDFAEGRTKAENIEFIKERLTALIGVVPELRYVELGADALKSDMSYDMVLTCIFDDLDGMNAYRVHPEHVKVSNYIAKVRESRVVVDYYAD